MDKPDDNACLERYRQGDVDALGELVERYRRPLFGFILRMTEGGDEADEIFQEVWIRAIRNLPRYRRGRLLSWLFRIAHNLVIDRVRQHKPQISLDDDEGGAPTPLSPVGSPADEATHQELKRRISSAVATLPWEQKEVFLMRMEAGLPFKEIAGLQKTSINTALARMTYALDKLKKQLADDYALLNRG